MAPRRMCILPPSRNMWKQRILYSIWMKALKDATANAPEYAGWMESAEVATYVKKNTSETVFEEFADWYAINKERFEPF